MKINTASVASPKELDKSQKLIYISNLTLFAISFFISNATILNSISPFAVAFTASTPFKKSYICFTGSLMGYIFLGGGISENLNGIIVLLCIMAIKFFLQAYKSLSNNVLLLSVLTGVVIIVVNIVGFLNLNYTQADIFLKISDGLLGGGLVYFFHISQKTNFIEKPVYSYNTVELFSLGILFMVVLSSTAGIYIAELSLGRILSVLLILVCGNRIGVTGAAVSGVLSVLSLTLYNPSFLRVSCLFMIAGFIASLFVPFKRLVQSIIFIVVNGLGILLIGSDNIMVAGTFEILISSLIFMIIPLNFLKNSVTVGQEVKPVKTDSINVKETLSNRLKFASSTLTDLQDSVEKVSKKINQINEKDISTVYTSTAEKVCKRCALNMFCWNKMYDETTQVFNNSTQKLRKNTRVQPDDFPEFFQKKCIKLNDLIMEINNNYYEFLAKETASRKVNQARLIAVEQFDGIANMLCEISQEISEISKVDLDLTKKARQVFESYNEKPDNICCYVDKFNRVCVEIYCDRIKTKYDVLTRDLSYSLNCEFDAPSVIESHNRIKISFFEKAIYSVDFYTSQKNCSENKVCGDSYDHFIDNKGFANFILSDGMGSGKMAAIDSVMTCSLILKLLKAGFGFDSAIKLINSSLLIKGSQESLATIDISCVDLYTGAVTIMKAGAANSFIKKKDKIFQVESNSLPIGILQNIDFNKNVTTMKNGDFLVMVSDGVLANGSEWLEKEILENGDFTAKQLSEHLSQKAYDMQNEFSKDDITVTVIKLKK